MTTAETVSGVVESRNERGIRVGGDWLNQSKFHPVELPDVGANVRVGLDAKGFITAVEVVHPAADTRVGIGNTRDRTITRLALVKAAAVFAASRPDMKAADVVLCARAWERYVTEED